MATNARTWFYQTPENNPYLLQERVNGTLWMARLQDVYFAAENTSVPFSMGATWQGHRVNIQWEPGKWFRLSSAGSAPALVTAFSSILQIPHMMTYTDPTGTLVTEWHRDGGDARWREIQGNPMYQGPARLGS
jgi:hypothetical protein